MISAQKNLSEVMMTDKSRETTDHFTLFQHDCPIPWPGCLSLCEVRPAGTVSILIRTTQWGRHITCRFIKFEVQETKRSCDPTFSRDCNFEVFCVNLL